MKADFQPVSYTHLSRQRIPLKQWLSRYQELTGADYGEYFRSWHTNGRRVFALNNMTALLERTDWKQVRKDILTTDADWLDLKEKLAFSDDFVEQNRETVTEFLLQGGAAMVLSLIHI